MLACITHWYTSLMYVAPVLGIGGWLAFMNMRERRREKAPRPAPTTAPVAEHRDTAQHVVG